MAPQDKLECPGPLVWFSVGALVEEHAILECATCDYLIVTGNWNDPAHAGTPVLREGAPS
ncbi:hypothetical protein [Amycolatopsis palatopharyngis]|uniref:hypothetical protein n=1 Tax=Amycolatopsis palatopharyngis TaxID=187982 RepID=UPI000E261A30|nr:hypothetical protein [Amycolatopsis palatopharyngis]